ncbi:hypothetical protein CTEN210_11322 [Chaetoceros tenuissimus]|uniref:Pentacotripeptide-repeat region of PRORP domain-containing protein n=1 Tax=Chaetoceros tenuissimus TaxID=426638 RepID=A0AAD3D145_9STRA|nr:hypothetical protein CTEN210_11322 [Chaetoceros tenuissimus]
MSKEAFDLSYQELCDAHNKLEQYTKRLEEYDILIQDEYKFQQTFQKLMSRCSRLGSWESAELTEQYLTLVLNSKLRVASRYNTTGEKKDMKISPSRQMFTLAMDAWASVERYQVTSRQKKLGRNVTLVPVMRSKEILDFMWEEYHQKKDINMKPDVIHYTTGLQSMANASSKKAVQMAQNLLKDAERRCGLTEFLQGSQDLSCLDPNLVPDRATYNTLLYCLSKYHKCRDDIQGRSHSAQYVMGLMKETMNKMQLIADKLNDDSWIPNTRSYNLLLMSCSHMPKGGGQEAEKILLEMIEKSTHLIDNSGKVILGNYDTIEDLEENVVLPNVKSFNNVINAWAHSESEEGAIRSIQILKHLIFESNDIDSDDTFKQPISKIIVPDTVTFNLVINAFSKSGLSNAGERAEEILNFMRDPSQENTKALSMGSSLKVPIDELNIFPDTITFNSTINAWSKDNSLRGASKAEKLLNQLIQDFENGGVHHPNSATFNAVINAWAVSGDSQCGSKAEKVFQKMKQFQTSHNIPNLEPTMACYNSLLAAYCSQCEHSGSIQSFESALEVLVRMEREGGFSPKTLHYNRIFSIPNKIHSQHEEKRFFILQKTKSILNEMCQLSTSRTTFAPDVFTFNHMIKACYGYEDEYRNREALFHLIDIYNMLCDSESCEPIDQIYINMLRTLQNILVENTKDRALLCEEIFRKCCENGLLTNAVLKIIASLLPPPSLRRLESCQLVPSSKPLVISNLPSEWSANRNVGLNQRRNRKRRK